MPSQFRERNVIQKDWRKVRLRVALCYPNIYRIGMTSLAVHLLYSLFNARPDVACERVFYLPGESPRSLESGQPLSRFDVIAFSLQFETDFVHALEMLLRSEISPLAADRERPWVIAGGPCVLSNPFPLEPFFDVFQVGDVEPVYHQLLDALITAQSRQDLEGFLDTHFLLSERIEAHRATALNLDQVFHPTCQILPEPPYPSELEPTFGPSLLVEVSRGCDRRCNFCLTTYQCSGRRERSLTTLSTIIDEGTKCTRVDKVSLLASGFTDHSDLGALLDLIVNQELQVSVPSLRADFRDLHLFKTIFQGGQRTLTFAPEAGSERLRDLIGKNIPDDVFHHTVQEAIAAGFNQFKLYFMIGLPTETDEDIHAIHQFCAELSNLSSRRHRLHVSIAPFVPKPHTPYQWIGLTPLKTLKRRFQLLRNLRKVGRVQLDLANPRWAVVQAALSRGTRELAPLLLRVARHSKVTAGTWFQTAKQLGLNLETLASADYTTDVIFPWDRIDVGIKRNVLLQRFNRLEQ
ncbi:MAG: B12-binding domain-containing radical SAM protein [Candidatus Thorarchaeota archaeon]